MTINLKGIRDVTDQCRSVARRNKADMGWVLFCQLCAWVFIIYSFFSDTPNFDLVKANIWLAGSIIISAVKR